METIKKMVKNSLSFVLVFMLVITGISTPVQMSASTSFVDDEITDTQNDEIVEQEETVSGEGETILESGAEEETVAEEETGEVESEDNVRTLPENFADDITFAKFARQDVDVTTDFSMTANEIFISGETLTVATVFEDAPHITNHKLTVEVVPGLELSSMPGMKKVAGKWHFLNALLPIELQGSFSKVEYIKDADFYPGVPTQSGRIEYTLSPGVTGIEMDFIVKGDRSLLSVPRNNTATLQNSINIKQTHLDNGAEMTKREASVQELQFIGGISGNGDITGLNEVIDHKRNTADNFVIEQGKPLSLPYRLLAKINAGYSNISPFSKQITFEHRVQKELGAHNVVFATPALAAYSTFEIDTTRSTIYDYVVIKSDNLLPTDLGDAQYYYDIEILPTAQLKPAGTIYTLFQTTNVTAAIPENVTYTSSSTNQDYRNLVVAPSFNNLLSIEEDTKATIGYVPYTTSKASEPVGDGTKLGGFVIRNPMGQNVDNQRLTIELPGNNIGVRAIQLPVGDTAKNIVVETTANSYYIPELTDTVVGNNGDVNKNVGFKLKDYTADENEYIKKVTYESGGYISGYGATSYGIIEYSHEYVPGLFYGHFLRDAVGENVEVNISVEEIGNVTNSNHIETKIPILETSKVVYGSTSTNAAFFPGETKKMSFSASIARTGNGNYASLVKGHNIYLRESEHFTIDTDSILVKQGTNEYSIDKGNLFLTKQSDNKGLVVYKISLFDTIQGLTTVDWGAIPEITTTYNMTANKNIPTQNLLQQEYVFIEPIDKKFVNQPNYTAARNSVTKDIYDVNENGDVDEMITTAPNVRTIQMTAQKDFTVTTAANLNGGSWVSYDYKTGKEKINLNPEGQAKYRLTVSNSSAYDIDGYTALVPIPKKDEKTPSTPAVPADFNSNNHLQQKPFEWTMSLLEELKQPIGGPFSYTFSYATTYEEDKDSANFKPWSAISDKNDIRMVKITTTSTIPMGAQDKIEFPLALTQENADFYAGKENIYSARIYREMGLVSRYAPSEPIAIVLKTGAVRGIAFLDNNYDGKNDGVDEPIPGITVRAFEAGTTNLIESVQTDRNGKYEFLGLDRNQNVDLVFVNPSNDDSMRLVPQTPGGSQGVIASDGKTAKVSNITPSGTESVNVEQGFMYPMVVDFKGNGGQTTGATEIKRYPGETLGASIPPVERKGYSFVEWKDADGTTVDATYIVTKSIEVKAQWKANEYELTYDSQGGLDGLGSYVQMVEFDKPGSKVGDPSRVHYEFAGWFTEPEGKGTSWTSGTTTLTDTNDKTIYAHWTAADYTIKADLKGGVLANGVTIPTTYTIETETITLPDASEITKNGYTFDGWVDPDDTNIPPQKITEIAKGSSGNKKITATWKATDYTIGYDYAGGVLSGTEKVAYTIEDAAFNLPLATRDGYTHEGWQLLDATNQPTGAVLKQQPAGETGNKKYKAVWKVVEYNITYNRKGGAFKTTPVAKYTIETPTFALPTNIEKDYYTFAGWEKGGTSITSIPKGTYGHITVDATWTATPYTITYADYVPGESSIPMASTYTVETPDITLPIQAQMTRVGHTFKEWQDGSQKVTKIAQGSHGDKTITAMWDANKYDLIFDLDGKGAAPTAKPVAYNTAVGTLPTPTAVGYTFKGWFTGKNGLGTEYKANTLMPASDTIVYAKWALNDKYIESTGANKNVLLSDVVAFTGASLVTSTYYEEDNGTVVLTEAISDADITINAVELAAIQKATEEGIYPLTYTTVYKGVTENKTIQVIVTTTPLVITEKTVVIMANNVAMQLIQTATADFVLEANAKAFEIDEHLEITRPVVPVLLDETTRPTKVGEHSITFVAEDATKSVTAIISKELPVGGEVVVANDFSVVLEDVATADFKTLANAKGFDVTDPRYPTPIAVIETSVRPTTIGTHTVRFETAGGAFIEVEVEVTEKPLNYTINIQSHGFIADVKDVEDHKANGTLESFILQGSDTKVELVFDDATTKDVKAKVDTQSMNNLNGIGDYKVKVFVDDDSITEALGKSAKPAGTRDSNTRGIVIEETEILVRVRNVNGGNNGGNTLPKTGEAINVILVYSTLVMIAGIYLTTHSHYKRKQVK